MFVGSDRGGRTAATLMSLVASCKLAGGFVDPGCLKSLFPVAKMLDSSTEQTLVLGARFEQPMARGASLKDRVDDRLLGPTSEQFTPQAE